MLPISKKHLLILILLFAIGLGLRVYRLGAAGFSEDESHKIEAIQAYLHGDITPNAEHPMLMKNLILISYRTEQWWNRQGALFFGRQAWRIRDEAAVRFPNAWFGAMTVFPLYWLAEVFLGGEIALFAAALWATGINAISFSRIAKEDTLLVFFMLFAFYFFRKAKLFGAEQAALQFRASVWCGVMFGLMLASKYFPGFLGINFLFYFIIRRHAPENRAIPRKTLGTLFAVMGVVFILANPSILIPSVWHYLLQYTHEDFIAHHGYQMMGKMYLNFPQQMIFGVPVYYYALYFLVKTPLPVLLLFLFGSVNLIRPRGHYGKQFLLYVFFLWFLAYSIVGAKWMRYSLHFIAFFYMIAAAGFFDAWSSVKSGWDRFRGLRRTRLRWVPASAGVLLVGILFLNAFTNLPYSLLYVNPLGGGVAYAATYSPQDEYYDAGFPQAYAYLAQQAPANSVIATDAQGVFKYYTQKFGRPDLQLTLLSAKNLDLPNPGSVYVLLHEGNRYFENEGIFQSLEANEKPLQVIPLRRQNVVRIYRLNPWEYAELKKSAALVAMAQTKKEQIR